MITRFVRHSGFAVVVESPGAVSVMDELAVLVVLVWTLPRDPAGLAIGPPQFRIDAAIGIDGCHENIGNFRVALGMSGLAGQRDADLTELRRQRGIQDR